ncbi:MAG: tRNA adenosine(34) deaminase TadA [Proteobacteria bacterium]|nr:tRNA adenosine(34) deaminase TadA [Pseudomonadota bacterium]
MTPDQSPAEEIQAQHERWMALALEQAKFSAREGEVPVGAVLVADNELLAAAHNAPISSHDPTAHAEIRVLRQASQSLGNYRLPGTTLYVTIEPCTMCVGALIHARVERLVFGAREPRAGAVVSQQRLLEEGHYNHRIQVLEGILADSCGQIMQAFFRDKRAESQS